MREHRSFWHEIICKKFNFYFWLIPVATYVGLSKVGTKLFINYLMAETSVFSHAKILSLLFWSTKVDPYSLFKFLIFNYYTISLGTRKKAISLWTSLNTQLINCDLTYTVPGF